MHLVAVAAAVGEAESGRAPGGGAAARDETGAAAVVADAAPGAAARGLVAAVGGAAPPAAVRHAEAATHVELLAVGAATPPAAVRSAQPALANRLGGTLLRLTPSPALHSNEWVVFVSVSVSVIQLDSIEGTRWKAAQKRRREGRKELTP